jgi:hypothetical protein
LICTKRLSGLTCQPFFYWVLNNQTAPWCRALALSMTARVAQECRLSDTSRPGRRILRQSTRPASECYHAGV